MPWLSELFLWVKKQDVLSIKKQIESLPFGPVLSDNVAQTPYKTY